MDSSKNGAVVAADRYFNHLTTVRFYLKYQIACALKYVLNVILVILEMDAIGWTHGLDVIYDDDKFWC